MKRIITLTVIGLLISVFSMGITAQRTYRSSYYKGSLEVDLTSMGFAKTNVDNQYVSITPTTPGYCTLAMYNFNFGGLNLGDIVMENTKLTDGDNGGFNLSCSQNGMSLAQGQITADVVCQGTLDVDGNIKLDIQVTYSGATIPITFTGAYTDEAGISEVTADTTAEVKYYDLNGQEMPSGKLAHGYYIKRQGDNITKILMR